MVQAKPDLQGLDNIFTFFCTPGSRTTFQGIQAVKPGHFLKVDFNSEHPKVVERQYWDFEFPQHGEHQPVQDEKSLIDELDSKLQESVRKRLRADVPVAAYLSGGVDSSLISSLVRSQSTDRFSTFTARVSKGPSEADLAEEFSREVGTKHHDINCDSSALSTVFPEVVKATDAPVADPNAGSLFQLSNAVSAANYKVVLTGEGADEAFAGYFWYKLRFMLGKFDCKFFRPFHWAARFCYQLAYRKAARGEFDRISQVTGGYHAHMMAYHCTSVTRWRLLNEDTLKAVQTEPAYDQLGIDVSKISRWHPLNQSLYFGYKTMLPGLLLGPRGDRVAMANSVETRYPFLDENLIDFCSGLHPSMKLRGLNRDKYLLRQMAGNRIPSRIQQRRKKMFRAPFANTFLKNSPPYVSQLLTDESLTQSKLLQHQRRPLLADVVKEESLATFNPPVRRNGNVCRAGNATLAPPLHRRLPLRTATLVTTSLKILVH